jgi:DNA-binding response OmpR family regulator
MGSKKILVVDDDADIIDLVKHYLKRDGYSVLAASESREARRLVRETRPALAVLNPALVGADGVKACGQSSIPIILLTTGNTDQVPIAGLESSVNDYMSKPVSPRKLAARVRTLLRRASSEALPGEPTEVKSGGLTLNFPQRQAYVDGRSVHLTPTEFKLLGLLMQEPNKILTRDQIMGRVAGNDFGGFKRTVDTHILNLRRKLERDACHPRYIQTVYGGGYRFGAGAQIGS